MDLRKLLLLGLTVLGLVSFGCGSDESEDDSNSNENAVEHFAQFVTHDGGIPMSEELDGQQVNSFNNGFNNFNTISTALTCSSSSFNSVSDIQMRIDNNGTFLLYSANQNDNIDDGRQIFGLNGEWVYEGDHMYFEGFGRSQEYFIDSSNFGVNSNCLVIQAESSITLQQNGNVVNGFNSSTTNQINSGSCIALCR